MKHTMRILLFTVGLAGCVSAEVLAQGVAAPETRAFVNINVGAQPRRQSLSTSSSLSIYGETATFSSSQSIGNGAIFEIDGGYKLLGNLGVKVSYSSFSKGGSASVTATVPHPLFFDQFKTTTQTAAGLDHTEHTVTVEAIYFMPLTEKIDLSFSIGPAFVTVKQGFVSSINVIPGTQDVTVATTTDSATSVGATAGFDGSYLFHRNVGAGLWVRYVGGTVTIPGAGDLKAGGFNGGIGLRLRF